MFRAARHSRLDSEQRAFPGRVLFPCGRADHADFFSLFRAACIRAIDCSIEISSSRKMPILSRRLSKVSLCASVGLAILKPTVQNGRTGVGTLAYRKAEGVTEDQRFLAGLSFCFWTLAMSAFRRSRFCSIATNSSRALETLSSSSSRASEAL
jgi:hypothetical protein